MISEASFRCGQDATEVGRDVHVTRKSVITIQYEGEGGRRLPSLLRRRGSFVAVGSANRRFRYVVYNQP
ncbi:MAG TPA: hypothetical protein VD704_08875 [Gaiellaceae bacterium]|nr:hypothetical protein [Gaiellaceae bacterium]